MEGPMMNDEDAVDDGGVLHLAKRVYIYSLYK